MHGLAIVSGLGSIQTKLSRLGIFTSAGYPVGDEIAGDESFRCRI